MTAPATAVVRPVIKHERSRSPSATESLAGLRVTLVVGSGVVSPGLLASAARALSTALPDSGVGELAGCDVHEQVPELGRFLQVGCVR